MSAAAAVSDALDGATERKQTVNPVGRALTKAIEREIWSAKRGLQTQMQTQHMTTQMEITQPADARCDASDSAQDFVHNSAQDSAQTAMQVRVLLRPLGAPPLVSLGAQDCVPSASTIKTLILLAALRRAAQNSLPLTEKITVAPQQVLEDSSVFPQVLCAYNRAESIACETCCTAQCTVEELLTWMIIRSDNTATNVLIDWLGMDAVNETARLLGLQQTVLRRKMLDFEAMQQGRDNTTSAADQYQLFAALYQEKNAGAELEGTAFLPPALQQKARDILCAQRDSEVLLRYLWQPVRVAHKTGELDNVRHDAGVFETSEPYFLAVLITHEAHAAATRAAEELAGRIGRLVYETQTAPAVRIREGNTPTLETQRLVLRKFEATDAAALLDILSDETANTFLPWNVIKTQEEATAFLQKVFLTYADKPCAYRYAICLKTDNVPIGYAWLSDGKENDFGYGLKQEFWHKGIATEACVAVLSVIRQAGYPFVTATHDVNNPRSGEVMKKLGMTYRYSYVEQWQPKNIAVTFKLYQINFDGNPARTYMQYWQESEIHFIEEPE